MTSRNFVQTTTALTLLACAGTVHAASSLYYTPSELTAAPGDPFTLELWMDFDQVTIGGAFEVFYDAEALQFESWNPAPLGMPQFLGTPEILQGVVSGIGFGDWEGITGLNLIGMLEMSVRQNAVDGSYSFTTLPWYDAPFVDIETFQVIPVDYGIAVVHVQAIPLPAAFWMLFCALAAAAFRPMCPRAA